tara:strand:+ start:39 stop:230 length:192 start_codon:yes stop_codon:yes gene_type:complete
MTRKDLKFFLTTTAFAIAIVVLFLSLYIFIRDNYKLIDLAILIILMGCYYVIGLDWKKQYINR